MVPTLNTTKVPPTLPTWIVKASWAGTSVKYLIPGKNEADAKDRCWKQIAKTMGGDTCLRVDVLGVK